MFRRKFSSLHNFIYTKCKSKTNCPVQEWHCKVLYINIHINLTYPCIHYIAILMGFFYLSSDINLNYLLKSLHITIQNMTHKRQNDPGYIKFSRQAISHFMQCLLIKGNCILFKVFTTLYTDSNTLSDLENQFYVHCWQNISYCQNI